MEKADPGQRQAPLFIGSRQLLDRRKFQTKAEARMAICSFIQGWYNPGRRHSALGFKSPVDYERITRAAAQNTSA
jgi:putative transposase